MNPKSIQDLFLVGMDRIIPTLRPVPEGSGKVGLNIGAGFKDMDTGSISCIDLDLPEWDGNKDRIPVTNNSIDIIHCYHFLEHIENLPFIMSEFQRALKVGGILNIIVPYYNSQMQAHDPNHKRVFCEESWKNFFSTDYYYRGQGAWRFKIGLNIIIGVVERNLCLMTQLIKEEIKDV